jgi:hypothetical protein
LWGGVIRNWIQKTDRARKMLKNESTQNTTKLVPLRPSRNPDSGGIFTLSNGLYMEKILRSVR